MFRTFVTLTVLLALLAACGTPAAGATVRLDPGAMKAALKTATPEEGGFIERVVDLVEAGKLPRSVVVSTFIWARKKPRWKFQYFKYGLILRLSQPRPAAGT